MSSKVPSKAKPKAHPSKVAASPNKDIRSRVASVQAKTRSKRPVAQSAAHHEENVVPLPSFVTPQATILDAEPTHSFPSTGTVTHEPNLKSSRQSASWVTWVVPFALLVLGITFIVLQTWGDEKYKPLSLLGLNKVEPLKKITTFQECVEAQKATIQADPQTCTANGQTFLAPRGK